MAHFAYVNSDNIVEKVMVVGNDCITEELYPDLSTEEARGQKFLIDLFGDLDSGCQWIQTSYNHNMRGTYAGIGYTYDPSEDIFVHPEPPDDSPSAEELAQEAE
jgi:hypothetical protein